MTATGRTIGTLALAFAMMSLCESEVQADTTVVELFTSQGCSSCPPADAVLGEFARQPGVIALAYHVDYWDDLGWKDIFALPVSVQRQRNYVKRLSPSGAFTPQSVVNGDESFIGSDRTAISHALRSHRESVTVTLSRSHDNLLIVLPAHASRTAVDVNLVAYLPEAATVIGRGENARRTLREYNIVRSFKRVGTWNGGASTLTVPLASLPADATGVAVLLQTPGDGPIAGAGTLALR